MTTPKNESSGLLSEDSLYPNAAQEALKKRVLKMKEKHLGLEEDDLPPET